MIVKVRDLLSRMSQVFCTRARARAAMTLSISRFPGPVCARVRARENDILSGGDAGVSLFTNTRWLWSPTRMPFSLGPVESHPLHVQDGATTPMSRLGPVSPGPEDANGPIDSLLKARSVVGRRKLLDQTTVVGAQRSCCWLFHFHRAVFWPDRTPRSRRPDTRTKKPQSFIRAPRRKPIWTSAATFTFPIDFGWIELDSPRR